MDLGIPSLSTATFCAPVMDSLFCTQGQMGVYLSWNCCSSAGSGGDRSASKQKRDAEVKSVSAGFCAWRYNCQRGIHCLETFLRVRYVPQS